MAKSPERLLLSSILRDGDFQLAATNGISGYHFNAYRDEWTFLERFVSTYGKTPTIAAFCDRFPRFHVDDANDTPHLIQEVRRSYVSGKLADIMRESIEDLQHRDIESALKRIHAQSIVLGQELDGVASDADIIGNFDDVLNEVQRRAYAVATEGGAGVLTSFPTFDEMTGGLQPGWLVIVAGRQGEGKSWTGLKMSVSAVMQGKAVQYNTLEMTRAEVGMRFHSFLSSASGQQVFNNTALSQGHGFNLREYRKFLARSKDLVKGRFHVADSQRGKLSALTLKAMVERNEPDLVVVDYITLMEKGGSDWQNIAQLSGDLKNLAVQERVPLVALSQLNRQAGITNGDNPANIEAITGSDSIGADADVVVTFKQVTPRLLRYRCVKNRHGHSGFTWWAKFDPGNGILEEVTDKVAQEIRNES
jgi:replicative DNA helicase